MTLVSGEPSRSEGAIDTAIRLLADRDARLARLVETLRAWQVRLAFVGHPQEDRLADGTPDWSEPVSMTDAALADA